MDNLQENDGSHGRLWSPIEGLPDDWAPLSDRQAVLSADVFREKLDELKRSQSWGDFFGRMNRQWAIETGAVENVYTISMGATRTLINMGLDAALINSEDIDGGPNDVMSLIEDQYDVIEGLYQFVASERNLSISYVRELHQVLTRHQPTYEALDHLQQRVTRPLPHGEFKSLPNNVRMPDGTLFEYCPPEHVNAEMERLLSLNDQYARNGVSPEVRAAWLHHRFTLIHPFVDGNGRIARCLATLVLLKDHWLPFLVTRETKPAYIAALRTADNGELAEFVSFIGKQQREGFRNAISLGTEVIREDKQFAGVLESLKEKLNDYGKPDEEESHAQAVRLATLLHGIGGARLREVKKELDPLVESANGKIRTGGAGPGDENAHWNRYQAVECAKKLEYFANFSEMQAWLNLSIEFTARLEILFSFHGIGHGHTVMFGCAACTYSREYSDDGKSEVVDVKPASDEPFEFTAREERENVKQRFEPWLEKTLATLLDEIHNNLP